MSRWQLLMWPHLVLVLYTVAMAPWFALFPIVQGHSRIIRNIKTSTVWGASRIVLEVLLADIANPLPFCCASMQEECSLRISQGSWKSDRTGQWCYTQHLQKSHSSEIGTNMKTTPQQSVSLVICVVRKLLLMLVAASCLIASCSSRCSRNIADVWDHLVQTSKHNSTTSHAFSTEISTSCRSLIGVPILFAGLWGIYHRAEPHVTETFVNDCMLPVPPLSFGCAGTILLVLPGVELHHWLGQLLVLLVIAISILAMQTHHTETYRAGSLQIRWC